LKEEVKSDAYNLISIEDRLEAVRNRYYGNILGQLIPEGRLDDRVGFVVWLDVSWLARPTNILILPIAEVASSKMSNLLPRTMARAA
jgi:hypothetical protein